MHFETDVTHRLFLINEEWAAKQGFKATRGVGYSLEEEE